MGKKVWRERGEKDREGAVRNGVGGEKIGGRKEERG